MPDTDNNGKLFPALAGQVRHAFFMTLSHLPGPLTGDKGSI